METAQNRRVGRPTTRGVEGEKSTLSVRASANLKQHLDNAAKRSGRSLSQEAELRLESSFHDERLMIDALSLLYGRRVAGLMLALADLMTEVGRSVGFEVTGNLAGAEDWLSVPTAYDEAVKAATALLDAFRPPGEAVPLRQFKAPPGWPDLQRVLDARASARGIGFARGHAALLTGEMEIGGGAGEKIATKRQLLGAELLERLRSAIKTPATGEE